MNFIIGFINENLIIVCKQLRAITTVGKISSLGKKYYTIYNI
jgi:hypothetical protein